MALVVVGGTGETGATANSSMRAHLARTVGVGRMFFSGETIHNPVDITARSAFPRPSTLAMFFMNPVVVAQCALPDRETHSSHSFVFGCGRNSFGGKRCFTDGTGLAGASTKISSTTWSFHCCGPGSGLSASRSGSRLL